MSDACLADRWSAQNSPAKANVSYSCSLLSNMLSPVGRAWSQGHRKEINFKSFANQQTFPHNLVWNSDVATGDLPAWVAVAPWACSPSSHHCQPQETALQQQLLQQAEARTRKHSSCNMPFGINFFRNQKAKWSNKGSLKTERTVEFIAFIYFLTLHCVIRSHWCSAL